MLIWLIIKAPSHNLTRPSLDAFCPKEFVIGRYDIFHIIAIMGFCFLVMTGQALLTSPKGRNASRDGLVK